MKLVGKLNEKVSKAKSNEEAKEIIKEAGMELTDEELEQVSGGYGPGDTSNNKTKAVL
ncbi:MAG: bacteriocin [Lachnospiraceae bacterium]|nr:bacteriocin [Lachnospiraceae bacterium]